MGSLIDKLFSEAQVQAIEKLWGDESTRLIIQQEIGKKLLVSDQIINELPLSQLMFITTLSPFASSEEECHKIASIIYWGIREKDILPSYSEHIQLKNQYANYANRCLISLSLFRNVLNQKCKRYGAPCPNFYRKTGISAYSRAGLTIISDHFKQWEHFLGEMFL